MTTGGQLPCILFEAEGISGLRNVVVVAAVSVVAATTVAVLVNDGDDDDYDDDDIVVPVAAANSVAVDVAFNKSLDAPVKNLVKILSKFERYRMI